MTDMVRSKVQKLRLITSLVDRSSKENKKADEDGKWKRISSAMEQEGGKWSHAVCSTAS